jgi:hypothetical protein
MPPTLRKIRIFVASPGDVTTERQQLAKVVDELNLTLTALAPEKGIIVELVRWETNVAPGLGRDAQDVVNRQIGMYDIFIGIMWRRFGTKTSIAGSGTVEEFQNAYEQWKRDQARPVLFYFCQTPFAPPRTIDDVQQLQRVVEFHVELSSKGLVWEYDDPERFSDIIRPHLLLVLSHMLAPTESLSETAQRSKSAALEGVGANTREQIEALVGEYEEVRKSMPSSDARTRRMAGVFSRMRALALSASPLLPELTNSHRAGMRLSAIAILQENPDPAYLGWLAARPASEKPFPGYQATMALLSAARLLGKSHRANVQAAIKNAQDLVRSLDWKDPNQVKALQDAQRTLDENT